ncbi:MAG: VCBS repeat-containing protein [Nitrospirae bacterium]|nr:VCBS repeat-containing protein [Nitrospirota bacterium]
MYISRFKRLWLICVLAVVMLTGCSSVQTAGIGGTLAKMESDERRGTVKAALPEPNKRCAGGKDSLEDESVAKDIGLSVEELSRLKGARGLSNKEICEMPTVKLARAIYKSTHPLRPDHPQEWARFRALQQADENGLVKPDGLINATKQRQALLTSKANKPRGAGISQTAWSSIGPGNVGGRVRSIVIHPTDTSKMWAGSVAGGIWKSTDGGGSWSAVNDFMSNLAISTMALDPSNPNVMYAGTGEGFFNVDALRGYGVFKSTDGGNTWSHLSATTPNSNTSSVDYSWYYVNRLAVATNGVILAATSGAYSNYGTIYRSTDGGTTWSSTFASQAQTWDVRFDPNNPNNAVAAMREYSASVWQTSIIRSTDGGQTWNKVLSFSNSSRRIELAYAPSNSQILYASRDNASSGSGQVYKSTDGGANWNLMSTPGHLATQGWYDNTIWVSPTDPDLVVIGGIDLYRSTNGGSNFTKISQWYSSGSVHADHHAIVHHPDYNGSSNKTVFFGNDGGLYKTTDITTVSALSGWVNINNSFGATQFYGGAGSAKATPSSIKIIGGTQDNGHLMTTGSASWEATNGGDGGFAAVDPTDSNYMYGEYVYLDIYRSTTGGTANSYSDICSGISDANSDYCGGTGETLFISPFILDPNNPNTMLAGGASLWRSTNIKGTVPTWSAIKSRITPYQARKTEISAIAVVEGDADRIWVGHANGALYYTTNGTAASPTWTKISASNLPARYVGRILIDKDNHNKVYAAYGGYSADNLYVSTDNGSTWTNITGTLPAAPIRSIVRHPSNANWLYAGTEVGIYTSEDGGAHWSTSNDGPANVSVDELFWYSDTQLVAATHGRGMFMATIGNTTTTKTPKYDFNNDGKSDILLYNTANGQVAVWLMNGTAISSGGSPGYVGGTWAVKGVGDFDGNGYNDILWYNTATGQLYMWFMNGSTVAGGGSPATVPLEWQVQGIGDFNGDGKSDILWYNTTTGQLAIWLMNGTSVTGGGSPGTVPLDWQVKGVGDFDGDGKSDILWSNTTTGQAAFWLMNGTSVTGGGSPGAVPLDWQVKGVGDFDGDSKTDVLWYNTATGQLYIWFMNGTSISSGGSPATVPLDWQIQGIGDFNGDSKTDIIWENTSTDQVAIWLMNGSTVSNGAYTATIPTTWKVQQ